jgi:catalase
MSLTDTLRQKITSVMETKKIADMQQNVLKQDHYYTTDHGVKVADTDNWQAVSTLSVAPC